MAFINGYTTKFECPICNIVCKSEIKTEGDSFIFLYKHSDNIIYINGYPSACPNNDKLLNESEVKKVSSPNIIISRPGYY